MGWPSLDTPLSNFAGRVDVIRQGVFFSDSAALARGPARAVFAAEVRGVAYFRAAAGLEKFVNDVVDGVVSEIEDAACSLAELRPSLLSLVCARELDSLRELRRLRMWDARAAIFHVVQSSQVATFPVGIRPMDGRTLRPEHFSTIWRVFGFKEPVVSLGVHVGVLRDLAESRNELAHGEEDPESIGRRKTYADVLKMLERIEEIALHLHSSASEYLDKAGFRR